LVFTEYNSRACVDRPSSIRGQTGRTTDFHRDSSRPDRDAPSRCAGRQRNTVQQQQRGTRSNSAPHETTAAAGTCTAARRRLRTSGTPRAVRCVEGNSPGNLTRRRHVTNLMPSTPPRNRGSTTLIHTQQQLAKSQMSLRRKTTASETLIFFNRISYQTLIPLVSKIMRKQDPT
jgi:hypothetical protein